MTKLTWQMLTVSWSKRGFNRFAERLKNDAVKEVPKPNTALINLPPRAVLRRRLFSTPYTTRLIT